MEKNKLDDPFPNEYDAACCNKAHLTKALKQGKSREDDANTNIPWDKDGKNGPSDPQNSMAILLDWMTTLGNYAKLKGDNANGATKIRIVGQISQKINAAGVRKERTTKSVLSKIDHLIHTYKKHPTGPTKLVRGFLRIRVKSPSIMRYVKSVSCGT